MSIKLPCDKCIHNKVCTTRGGSNQDGVCKYFDEQELKGEEWLDNFINRYNKSKDFKITDIRDREKLLDDLRPKGEWIEESSETGALGIKYPWIRCNQCGWDNGLVIPKNFCPNCGAKMRGDKNDSK